MQDLRCYFAESNHSVLTPGTLEVPSQNISGLSGMFLQLKVKKASPRAFTPVLSLCKWSP